MLNSPRRVLRLATLAMFPQDSLHHFGDWPLVGGRSHSLPHHAQVHLVTLVFAGLAGFLRRQSRQRWTAALVCDRCTTLPQPAQNARFAGEMYPLIDVLSRDANGPPPGDGGPF